MSSKRAAKHGGASASLWAVSGWSLRRKLSLALAIPLLLAATLGGLRVHSDLVTSANSASSAEQVTVLSPAIKYLDAAERATVAAVGDDAASQAALKAAVDDLRKSGGELSRAKDSAHLTAAQRDHVDALLDLSQAMRAEDALQLSPGTWQAELRQLHSGVTQLISSIVNEQLNPEPKLDLLSQALAGRFSLALEQALAAGDRKGDTGSTELFSELGAEGAAIDRLASGLGTDQKEVASLRTANAERFRTIRVGRSNLGGPAAYADYDSTISSLQHDIDSELSAAADTARSAAFVNAAVTIGALVAAVLLALLVSRLLLAPIRRVREGALAVAREQLPDEVARIRAGDDPGTIEPIDVTSREEIGQLARAVDDLHRQAVVLASGEASLRSQVSQMFVTLSRRNTSLINQQLSQIERLERDEEDPKRLESLFQLDHLAARMRRTADSLLVLADVPGSTGLVEGLTVSDAVEAAASGVQDYQRVQARATEQSRLRGDAGADVVHLLTELVDNALTFSPPTSQVVVRSAKSQDGVAIEIVDAGLGMPADQLADINRTLRSGGEVTSEAARRMGLFVVSRLSQRHGIKSSLRANEQGGTTATVVLPHTILSGLEPAPAPVVATPRAGVVVLDREPEQATRPPGTPPEPARDDVESRINAALGLPARTPGASWPAAGPVAPTPPISTAAGAAVPRLPQRGDRPQPVAAVEEPAPASPFGPVPAPRLQARSTSVSSASSASSVSSVSSTPRDALEGEWTDPGDDAESPIFRQLSSAWFSGGGDPQDWRTTEIEEGWQKADAVADTATALAEVSDSGLPMRRPGTRLVPGGVEQQSTAIARDPDAIRARLSAHASGVSRGRREASSADTDRS